MAKIKYRGVIYEQVSEDGAKAQIGLQQASADAATRLSSVANKVDDPVLKNTILKHSDKISASISKLGASIPEYEEKKKAAMANALADTASSEIPENI